MSEILLVHSRENARTFGGMAPLGLGWIASYIESKGYKTDLVDLQITRKTLTDVLQESKPKILGISGTTHTRYESSRLAREAKHYDPNLFVMYGGSHATFTALDTMTNVREIDLVVKGEGERSALQVVEKVLRDDYDFAFVDGISYRKNGRIYHNGPVIRIEDLDSLPMPRRNPEDLTKYDLEMDFLGVPAASVITSRGCPINCSYCSASAMFGKMVTLRSAESVVDEIELLLKEHGAQGIKFFDSTLTLKKSHILSLCEEINRRKLKFPWECEIRVNTVNWDILRAMRDAGCYYVDFGVESASPRVLRDMHKGIKLEQAENVFRWTKELGIRTKAFFTFGHIRETMEDAKLTLGFIDKWAKYITKQAVLVGIRIYPGTRVEKYAYEIGCLDKDFSWAAPLHNPDMAFFGVEPNIPLLIQPQMGYQELKQLRYTVVRKKMRTPTGMFRMVKHAWDRDNLQKVLTVAKGMIKTRLSGPRT